VDVAAASCTSRGLGLWSVFAISPVRRALVEVLWQVWRLLIFSSVVTLALNVVFTPDPGQLCSSPK
jgi:hypothetical protein